jgi:hypothetical protein
MAAGVAALLIGFVVALIVAGGDDDRPPGPETAERTARTETGSDTETTTETATAPQPVEPAEPTVPQRDLAAIQATVVLLVESAETRDARGVCRALGQAPVGTSRDVAQECADRAGIDLATLPGSDELSFEEVEVSGTRARAELASGDAVILRRRGGRWVVTSLSR